MRCGARWRKPVDKITDRRKRQRANHPDCKPKGKRCATCGSTRNLLVGHKDGDESNGAKSNLITQCKSCNTKHGKAMAKAGKGVRTRQYNPRITREWMRATDSQVLQERLKKNELQLFLGGVDDERKKKRLSREKNMIIRELHRRGHLFGKNPGAKTLGEYVSAAVSHIRGSHDEAGKLIHETPKARRSAFAREIWNRRGRKNPESASDRGFRKFHGFKSDQHYLLDVPEIDPYGNHPELFQCGFLLRLIVGEGVKLHGQDGDEAEATPEAWENGTYWVDQLEFVPSLREYRTRMEDDPPRTQAHEEQLKAWLRKVGCPDVAGVPDFSESKRTPLASRQLYIVGGNQFLDDKRLIALGADPEKDICDLGFAYLIEYRTQKRFDGRKPIDYWHHFGEKSGVQPRVIYHRRHKVLQLVGGEYVVKSVGIDN